MALGWFSFTTTIRKRPVFFRIDALHLDISHTIPSHPVASRRIPAVIYWLTLSVVVGSVGLPVVVAWDFWFLSCTGY